MTTTTSILRKGALAYIGLYGTAFDRAQARFSQLQSVRKTLVNTLANQGETLEGYAGTGFKSASDVFMKTYACGAARTRKFLPQSARTQITKLESEIAELNVILAGLKKTAKTTKTTKAKPAKAKAAKKAAVKTIVKTKAPEDKYAAYYEAVCTYDADASKEIVRKIVNHCGIALSSRDGKFVACTDEAERHTVRDSWLKKKLGLEASNEVLDTKVMSVCETMKADRMKNRVTFYYLLAKNEDMLANI